MSQVNISAQKLGSAFDLAEVAPWNLEKKFHGFILFTQKLYDNLKNTNMKKEQIYFL